MSAWQLERSGDLHGKAREKLEKVGKYGGTKIRKRGSSAKKNHYFTNFETVTNRKKRFNLLLNMFSNFSGRQGMTIFNKRRRPRQAVYASPLSQTTTTFTTDVPDEQLVDMVQDFEPGPRLNNYNSVSNYRPSTQYSNTSSTRSLQTRNLPPLMPLKHPNNNFNQENNQPKFENNFSACSRANNGTSSGQQKPVLNNKPSWQTGNYSANKQQKSSSTEFRFDKNLVKQQSLPKQNQSSWSNPSTYSPMKASNAGGIAKQPRENDEASFGATQNKYKKIKVDKETNESATSNTETFTLKTVDKSMKFITSTIQDLRKWSEYREEVPITFEIFATLDSVPTSNNSGTAKLFSIKDSTGMIRCIYWEMDQKLPRMARGQIYRLVGALERKTGHFQCFTVRQAQPDEQRFAGGQATLCDNALTKVFSMMAEA